MDKLVDWIEPSVRWISCLIGFDSLLDGSACFIDGIDQSVRWISWLIQLICLRDESVDWINQSV